MVRRRVAEMLEVVDEETANLARYRVALGSLEGETEDVVGAITYLNFNRVHDRFYDLVLRADLGKIDVSWARREDHRLRIDALTRERARELQALDDEFRDVMDESRAARASHDRALPLRLAGVRRAVVRRHRELAAPAAAQEEDAAPWEGATDVTLPPFLQDTGKRIVDQRPPPTEQQLEALRQLEEEVDRFTETGEAFRSTVTSLVRREYLHQRRERDRWYGEQLETEERAFNEARESSIRVFEDFIRRYPNHSKYTPDAMFRLGELYFERSAVDFQKLYDDAQAARDAGDLTAEDSLPTSPDFTPTVDLYKTLARRFPAYERSDGVYYLIGYTLNEMGRPEEALAAWLALVCSNKYDYDPDWRPPPADASLAAQAKYPALTLDGRPLGAPVRGAFVNPYETCKAITPQARFVSETWFRIGEYHFDDFGGTNALDLSIAAYGQILENPQDRNYNLALYKVAWAYYRASRYPEAIRHFGKLVQWSDDTRSETGKAGSELRPEAIEYLGIAFAYDDWNENQVADPIEGRPTGIERIQDASLLPQQRPWTPEVYFQLGQVYFDEAKYLEAIAAWRLAIRKWPNHHRTPEVLNDIAVAHQMHNEFENAIVARSELTQYVQGSPWWNANMDRPAEQRNAEQLAENALIVTAIHHHQLAQRLRQQCVEERNVQALSRCQAEYELAATRVPWLPRALPEQPTGLRAPLQPRRRLVLVEELRAGRDGVRGGS